MKQGYMCTKAIFKFYQLKIIKVYFTAPTLRRNRASLTRQEQCLGIETIFNFISLKMQIQLAREVIQTTKDSSFNSFPVTGASICEKHNMQQFRIRTFGKYYQQNLEQQHNDCMVIHTTIRLVFSRRWRKQGKIGDKL